MSKRIQLDKVPAIYQARNGLLNFVAVSHETIWATQVQIVELFGVDQSVVSRHIRNIFKDGEIEEKSNMQKTHNAFCYFLLTLKDSIVV